MEPPADITDAWGVLAVAVTTAGTVLVAWLTARAKKGSDHQDKEAEPVIREVEHKANLQPVVDGLARRLAELQIIAQEKYPDALSFIRLVGHLHPDLKEKIPGRVRDDL
ncbi:hypothetical protein NYP18_09290 [Corynebacterium sp. YIM 101645]|uniref:Secreted protein n=1 Tax=Corynebacterium lemuris TaxID=1859292 RepID=A0ABT2FZG5_9CORY|nr:hypothetical protein [Corynebacterium lemuris]MCS5479853.1 hypothetical protein [Corynebacterium lemuris]